MKIECLAGKMALGIAYSKDYTDWAENLLCDGVESDNIAILAGFGLDKIPDSEKVEQYFHKCLEDLGLELPSEKEALLTYAKYLSENIVDGKIFPETGLNILCRFYYQSNYDVAIYSNWDELSEDIWMVKESGDCVFNTGLTRKNINSYIKKVAKQFLQLTRIDLPDHFFYLSTCEKCGHIGDSTLEQIEKTWISKTLFKFIFRRSPVYRVICTQCSDPNPKTMSDYEGRKQYIETLRY